MRDTEHIKSLVSPHFHLTSPYQASPCHFPFYVSIPVYIIINLIIISASVQDGTDYWLRLNRVGNPIRIFQSV